MSATQATLADFKIYEPEFQAGLFEALTRNVDAFNANSRNAIRMIAAVQRGEYEKRALFDRISNLVTRRDQTSVAAATSVKPTQDEEVDVKLNRKIGPVDLTLDALRKAGITEAEFSMFLGMLVGQEQTKDMLDSALIAGQAAIDNQTTAKYDYSGTGTITTSVLVDGLNKFGDQAGRIVAWVMHSKVFHDLLKEQISAKITNVADAVIYGAMPGSFNRPVIVTDSSALFASNGSATDTYNTLGLVEGGITIKETEPVNGVYGDIVNGYENLIHRTQAEYAYNVGVKGFAYGSGGANPTAGSLGTGSNWTLSVSSVKAAAGIEIVTQ